MEKKSNTKQALWIAVGNLFSTGMGIVSAMILSRYFTKEDYGTYKQVLYIYSTTQIVFTLGLPRCYSFFLPNLPISQAKHTINKITNIFYVAGAIFAILLYAASPLVAEGLKNSAITEALRIYSPVALFLLPTLGLEGILATYQKSEYIALYNAMTRIFMLVCVVGPVIAFHGSYRMALWGFVFSSFITYVLAVYLRNMPLRGIKHEPTSVKYRDIWNFSLPLMFASIWGALINSTDQFFISRYFGTEAFANFSNGATSLPFVGIVTASVATVLTPVLTRDLFNKEYSATLSLWRRSTLKSAKLILPLIIFFMIFAVPTMTVMYGSLYSQSAPFFLIKQVEVSLQVVNMSLILISMGQTRYYSKVHMLAFLVLLPIEYGLSVASFSSAYYVTIGHTIVSIGMTVAVFAFVCKKLDVKALDFLPAKNLLTIVLLSVGCGCLSYLAVSCTGIAAPLTTLALGFFIFCIIFFPLSIFLKFEYSEIIKSVLPGRITKVFYKQH